eukprot:GHVH01005613.1.p1 GENE.GHVH01005613.1~~GHVH01005613.1.p1  ORF type:complete len:344 (+),score=33.10 GHVH01005613.1:663-1694(+)
MQIMNGPMSVALDSLKLGLYNTITPYFRMIRPATEAIFAPYDNISEIVLKNDDILGLRIDSFVNMSQGFQEFVQSIYTLSEVIQNELPGVLHFLVTGQDVSATKRYEMYIDTFKTDNTVKHPDNRGVPNLLRNYEPSSLDTANHGGTRVARSRRSANEQAGIFSSRPLQKLRSFDIAPNEQAGIFPSRPLQKLRSFDIAPMIPDFYTSEKYKDSEDAGNFLQPTTAFIKGDLVDSPYQILDRWERDNTNRVVGSSDPRSPHNTVMKTKFSSSYENHEKSKGVPLIFKNAILSGTRDTNSSDNIASDDHFNEPIIANDAEMDDRLTTIGRERLSEYLSLNQFAS